ncbi:oligosaccharide flippase family protein [Limosilactobacillus balticus]|uniref:lipopolysaccharide biosynthesis protein n=1 Tax=Limosilactobacillus balticus TaxID=2759747 RepID=UPI001E451D84|nr:oligosaccharide flippase family protein [Limosilactobacillus balticus]MCD7135784.1 oligosaccharide flippase family protein [Limosilactobacillus balticus]
MNNKSSRSNLAFRNSIVSGLVTLLNFPIQFINRYFMVHYLGATYLGLTSLFTNILSVLSLADLGIGTAIVFLMYKPLADHDYDQVALIMRYYRKIYQAIALVIFTLGICVLPFLRFFIGKSISYPHVYWLFIIYLLGSASSYLFSYNQSLLYANQQNRIVSWINLIVTYVMLSIQIYTVIFYHNPLLYAALFVFSGFVTNILVSIYVRAKYPLKKSTGKLSRADKHLLIQNVVGNMFMRVSGVVVTGTDNILLSVFAGVIKVGLYANYVTITTVIQKFMYQIIGAVTGSIGNFAVTKSHRESEKLFNNLQYINFIILNVAVLGILFLSNDVISLWLGQRYVLSQLDVILIAISFYVINYRVLGWSFISVYGLARYMKVFSISEMIANIVFSLFYMGVLKLQLTGVLLGTITSTVLTVMWQDPYIIFHHAFHSSVKPYFKRYLYNLLIIALELIMIFKLNEFLPANLWAHFFALLGLVILIGLAMPLVFYWRTTEFKYVLQLLKKFLQRR